MIPLRLTKISTPAGSTQDIVVDVYYKEYYAPSFTLLASNVPVLANGTIQASPALTFNVDPTLKYVVRANNLLCDSLYDQIIEINPYCEIGYDLSQDSTYCYKEEISSAIPPSSPQMTVARTGASYGTCGSYIYSPGYNINGTGASTQIPTSNAFWVNGAGLCADATSTDGPVNRSALWATTPTDNQDIGFSRCIPVPETKTYYLGIACDNYGVVDLDGVNIITQNETALNAQYSATGACFKVFHIYPILLSAGNPVLTVLGHNVSGAAAVAVEIYSNTSAEIIAATSYSDLNLVFSSKDYRTMPVQIGSGGSGWSCSDPDAFVSYCDSPIVCKKRIISNIKY